MERNLKWPTSQKSISITFIIAPYIVTKPVLRFDSKLVMEEMRS